MANVNSLTSSSSSSSLYGTRNVLSGLASGLDTEALIENSISGYKTKISSLQQQQEKITWQQDAFREITDQMSSMITSFTSYTSKTNLYSTTFFSSAITTQANGTYADKLFAAGKSTSTVQINGVSSLATATRYSVKAYEGAMNNTSNDINWTDWDSKTDGKSFSVTFDGAVKNISFSELKSQMASDGVDLGSLSDEEKTSALSKAMGKVLGKKFGEGRIEVSSVDSRLTFSVASGASIRISADDAEEALGVNGIISNQLSDKKLAQVFTGADNGWSLTVNGVTIEDISGASTIQEVMSAINDSDAGVSVSYSELTGQFSFVSKSTGASNDIDIGGEWGNALFNNQRDADKAENVSLKDAFGSTSSMLSIMPKFGDGTSAGIKTFSLRSGSTLANLKDWLDQKGIHVSYDDKTGYSFDADDPAKLENFAMVDVYSGKQYSLEDIFKVKNSTYQRGTDAVINATINGQNLTFSRATNTVELDGMEVTLRDTFNVDSSGQIINMADAVTFNTKTDSDKVVDAVKSFVEQYNNVLSSVRTAFTTQPLELDSSKHTKYMPLTDDDKSTMSEAAIKNYEEKAKTGILYNDSDLRNLYSQLVDLAGSTGADRIARESIGLSSSYSNGLTQLTLDEDALRAALERDPDSVQKVFTNPDAKGGTNSGWMEAVKTLFNTYSSTTVSSPGILVNKAGSKLSAVSLNNNTLQDKINLLAKQIETWQDKMSSKIDYYTNQFTAMEQLINTMNNQSSMLAGLTGGY